MSAAIRKAAPLLAIAVAAMLAGCAVEPAPVYDAYYTGPSAVFVEPIHPFYDYGFYHYGGYGYGYGHGYGGGYHPGGGMHGRG